MKLSAKKDYGIRSRSNATFVEYALLIGLVAIGVAVAIAVFGDQLFGLFGSVGDRTEDVAGFVDDADISMPGN